jgi:hypothetical protein
MMMHQQFEETLLSLTDSDDGVINYLQKNNPTRIAEPTHHRAILGLPPIESLTPEDYDEYPAKERIVGEDPFWLEQLKA